MKEYNSISISGTFVFTLISDCDPNEIGTLTENPSYTDQVQKTLDLLLAETFVEFMLPTYTVSNDDCLTYQDSIEVTYGEIPTTELYTVSVEILDIESKVRVTFVGD